MPWDHCGAAIADSDPCPGCGLSKAEWTVQADRTRTLRVNKTTRRQVVRDAWLELALLDAAGAPVAGAPYRVALPSGRVVAGALDAAGAARLTELPAGVCEVSFPDHAPEGVDCPTGARHERRLGAAAGGLVLEAVLRTSRGEPLEHTAFVVRDAAGGEVARGVTDARGVARAAVPADAEYRVELAYDALPDADAPEPLLEERWEEAWARAAEAPGG